ncbi:putative pilus system protein FilF [Acinetobacter haemolyticus]|uniref:putative pilus system protein FilF n=1 Tax=Acinetobacter haemolyticus TaxID=29430 RepID=UPI0002E21CF0|nr:hypothetical protein [Acinetobacter haemolyticus]
MKRRIFVPFALSALTLLLTGCGGESAKINEDPNKGVSGITSNTSCDVKAENCLQFAFDYPIAGVNFDCSTELVHRFATKLVSNAVTGACKIGDTATFYIQGEESPKINLGAVNLDNISKTKLPGIARIRVIDLATGLTGKSPTTLDLSDETIQVAVALIRIFQSLGAENNHNVIGDIQPTEITQQKKNKLSDLSQNIDVSELISGKYVELIKPWTNVDLMTDIEALTVLKQLLNMSNTAIWEANLPIYKQLGDGSKTVAPQGFFACNNEYAKCFDSGSENLVHSMGRFLLLTDRQGYIFGYGQQWIGSAVKIGDKVQLPFILVNKVKPRKIQLNTQSDWINPFSYYLNTEKPLTFSSAIGGGGDLVIRQGRFINQTALAGTEGYYRVTSAKKESDPIDNQDLGKWRQQVSGQIFDGTIDITKLNPATFLSKDVFKTELNVASGQTYLFPLYATLTFRFDAEANLLPVDLGVVIDEHGDIRTDIRKNATATDMSGECANATANPDGTYTDEYGETQYRIGTTGTTNFSEKDKSISVRFMLSNPKFDKLNGATFGLNFSTVSGAKINIHGLLDGQSQGINLTNFDNQQLSWSNFDASAHASYVFIYDNLEGNKNEYIPPTEEERELAKRWTGTVTIKIADQNNPACKAIKTKA